MTPDPQAAVASPEAEAVVESLRAFVDAVNRGDQPAALGVLAPDVTIVEDLPPYRWHGPAAGRRRTRPRS